MSELKWNPFAALQQQRAAAHEDNEAQAILADATVNHGDPEPDIDQGQRTTEPAPQPDMNALIRRAVGINVQPGKTTPPEIGD